MTIASTVIRSDVNGTGITGPYTFSFCVFNIADLQVIWTDSTGVSVALTLGADYSVVGIRSGSDYTMGGVVTLVNPLASGDKLTLMSNVDGTQNTSIQNNAQYYAVLHENEFDKLALVNLQTIERVSKCIKAPDSEAAGTATLDLPTVANRANKMLGFDASGNIRLV